MAQDGIAAAPLLFWTRQPSRSDMSAEQRKDIRDRMRQRRRQLSQPDRVAAATKLLVNLNSCQILNAAKQIAAYFPNDGEIDPWPVIRHAWALGKLVYLPIVQADRMLSFVEVSDATVFEQNRYGIAEPRHTKNDLITADQLDMALVPLTAFDDKLFRLGMGGGYYDKTFAYTALHLNSQPKLIGIGYDFQRVATVYGQQWDVPADVIVTDKTIYHKVEAK